MLSVLGSVLPAAQALAASCVSAVSGYWQIIRETSDLPQFYYDGYRVDSAGVMQSARWSRSKRLLALGEDLQLSAAEAQAFRDAVEHPAAESGQQAQGPSQPVAGVLTGLMTEKGTRSERAGALPEAVTALLDRQLRQIRQVPAAGHYIWSKPVSGIRPIDIDLRGERCTDGVAEALAGALASGRMIVPVQRDFAEYFAISRAEFGARLARGYLGFGVVRA